MADVNAYAAFCALFEAAPTLRLLRAAIADFPRRMARDADLRLAVGRCAAFLAAEEPFALGALLENSPLLWGCVKRAALAAKLRAAALAAGGGGSAVGSAGGGGSAGFAAAGSTAAGSTAAGFAAAGGSGSGAPLLSLTDMEAALVHVLSTLVHRYICAQHYGFLQARLAAAAAESAVLAARLAWLQKIVAPAALDLPDDTAAAFDEVAGGGPWAAESGAVSGSWSGTGSAGGPSRQPPPPAAAAVAAAAAAAPQTYLAQCGAALDALESADAPTPADKVATVARLVSVVQSAIGEQKRSSRSDGGGGGGGGETGPPLPSPTVVALDDLLPTVIWLLCRLAPRGLSLQLAFVRAYAAPAEVGARDQCYLTLLESAARFLLDPGLVTRLTLSSDWDRTLLIAMCPPEHPEWVAALRPEARAAAASPPFGGESKAAGSGSALGGGRTPGGANAPGGALVSWEPAGPDCGRATETVTRYLTRKMTADFERAVAASAACRPVLRAWAYARETRSPPRAAAVSPREFRTLTALSAEYVMGIFAGRFPSDAAAGLEEEAGALALASAEAVLAKLLRLLPPVAAAAEAAGTGGPGRPLLHSALLRIAKAPTLQEVALHCVAAVAATAATLATPAPATPAAAAPVGLVAPAAASAAASAAAASPAAAVAAAVSALGLSPNFVLRLQIARDSRLPCFRDQVSAAAIGVVLAGAKSAFADGGGTV